VIGYVRSSTPTQSVAASYGLHYLQVNLQWMQFEEGMHMALFRADEYREAAQLATLWTCNPFLPEWVEWERSVLGKEDQPAPPVYAWQPGWEMDHLHVNLGNLGERCDRLVERARARLAAGAAAREAELRVYEELAFYYLFRHSALALDQHIMGEAAPLR